MADETIYQAMVVKTQGADYEEQVIFHGCTHYTGKEIPPMTCHIDAVRLCRFIGFPRMAVVSHIIDCDTGQRLHDTETVLDVLGVEAYCDPRLFNQLGDTTHKSLTYWPRRGICGSPVFPNVKEGE